MKAERSLLSNGARNQKTALVFFPLTASDLLIFIFVPVDFPLSFRSKLGRRPLFTRVQDARIGKDV